MAISQDRLTALLSSGKLQLQAWSADGRLSSAAQQALQMGVASAPELSGRRSTLLVFDASLAGIDVLLAGADASAVRLLVRPEDDAIALIAAAAAEGAYTDLVVVAHGSPGVVHLGAGGLDAEQVRSRAAEVQSWGFEAIHLYSCSTGQEVSLKQELAAISGATVHASEAVVGHSSLGGSWEIDNGANGIVAFSRAAKQAWVGALIDIPLSPPGTYNFREYPFLYARADNGVGGYASTGTSLSSGVGLYILSFKDEFSWREASKELGRIFEARWGLGSRYKVSSLRALRLHSRWMRQSCHTDYPVSNGMQQAMGNR